MKIKNKFLAFFLLMTVFPLTLLGIFSSVNADQALEDQADSHFTNTLKLISLMITSKTKDLHQAAQSLGEDREVLQILSRRDSSSALEWLKAEQTLQIRMMTVRQQNPDIRSVMVIMPDREFLRSGVATGFELGYFQRTFAASELFHQLMSGSNLPVWMTGLQDNFDRIHLFRRLQDTITGEVLGLLVFSVDTLVFTQVMDQALGLSDGEIVLTNGLGKVIASHPTNLKGQIYPDTRARVQEKYLRQSLPVAQNWMLYREQSMGSVLAGTRYLVPLIITFSLTLAILSLILSLGLTEHFSRPIFSLIQGMKKAETGEFSRVEEIRKDEFNQLFHGYNAMVQQLGRLFDQQRRSLEEISAHKESLEKTVRERTEKLLESEKMASLGGLVAGVAHEINTPLGIGITSVSYIEEHLNQLQAGFETGTLTKTALQEFLQSCSNANSIAFTNLKRAAELVQSFKRVAVNQSTEELRIFSLRESLEDTIKSLGPRASKTRKKIELNCPGDLRILSFPGDVYQVASNLILNALIHAWDDPMSEGRVEVTAEWDGKDLELSVSDNGKGMEEVVRKNVFEPFFTTKRDSGGSGLGLSVVFNLVVQKLGGQIHCESSPGAGTSFRIRLPGDVVQR